MPPAQFASDHADNDARRIIVGGVQDPYTWIDPFEGRD